MSYVIRYGQQTKQENMMRKVRQKQWIAWTVPVVCILIAVLVPSVNSVVNKILFPWLNDRTVAAFEAMVTQIGDGTAVSAALIGFCREIISHAWIPV